MKDTPKISSPDDIASQLISVQPMPNDFFSKIYDVSKSREELKAEGYKPVCDVGLVWVKDEKEY